MAAWACFATLQTVAVLLVTGGIGRGQLFGPPPQETLQEFIGLPFDYEARAPTGYGTPKPYLPVIRKIVSDGQESTDHGDNSEKSLDRGRTPGNPPERGDSREWSSEDLGRNRKYEEKGRDKQGKSLGNDYESLKQAAVKSLSRNGYGFKYNPKKFRNPLPGKLEKSSDDSGRPDRFSDGLNLVYEKNSDFFSQPDWSGWPQDGDGKSRENPKYTNNGHKSGFQSGGFFGEEYSVENDPKSRPSDGENSQHVQRQSTRNRHNSLQDFGNMLSFESSKSRGTDSYSYSGDRDLSSWQNHGDSSDDFTDSRPEFDAPKQHPESEDFKSLRNGDEQHNNFEFQNSAGFSDDHSSSDDFGKPQKHSASRDFGQGRDFDPPRHRGSENTQSGPETTSYSDFGTSGGSQDEHPTHEEANFESQRTSQHIREGYNTPKPYKPPPPTTPAPRHEPYPLVRPAYPLEHFPEHDGAAYPHSEHGQGLFGPSQHTLLGYNAAKHATGHYSQVYYDVETYPDVLRHGGYPGYSPYIHGYHRPQELYPSTTVHSDEHKHPEVGYGTGTGAVGYSAVGYPAGYNGGYLGGYRLGYNSKYPSGYNNYDGLGYRGGQVELKGVKLHQITRPIYPDHDLNPNNHIDHFTDYAAHGYAIPGYAPAGYVSLEYVPAGYAASYGGGYGLKLPEHAAAPHGHAFYGLPGYGGRPYRRADVDETRADGRQETAASQLVGTVAAGGRTEGTAEPSEPAAVTEADGSPVPAKTEAAASQPVEALAAPEMETGNAELQAAEFGDAE